MPEAVKVVAIIILALIVLLIILFTAFVLLGAQSQKNGEPPLKIGRGICNFGLSLFLKILDFTGWFSNLTSQGFSTGCNQLNF